MFYYATPIQFIKPFTLNFGTFNLEIPEHLLYAPVTIFYTAYGTAFRKFKVLKNVAPANF